MPCCPDDCEYQTENDVTSEGGCYFCKKYDKPLKDYDGLSPYHIFSALKLPECEKDGDQLCLSL